MSLTHSSRRKGLQGPRARKLALEHLESRLVLSATIAGVSGVEIVARLTGTGGAPAAGTAINDTLSAGVGGTDLGHMVNHQGSTYFLFGDTFSGSGPHVGGNWRGNVMAYSRDLDPADGVTFDGWITDERGIASHLQFRQRLPFFRQPRRDSSPFSL